MDIYKIVITPTAKNDLIELKRYITEVILAPETAKQYIRAIRVAIQKLSYAAGAMPLIYEELWRSKIVFIYI